MIEIDAQSWREMVEHAEATYPNECCGAMLGSIDGDEKKVLVAMRLDNAAAGSQRAYYELRPEDLLRADREARERKMDLIGIYHSHPDCDAYFSQTDLKNSCRGTPSSCFRFRRAASTTPIAGCRMRNRPRQKRKN